MAKLDEGFEADLEVHHLDYIWWYKADGERTSGKLPQDPFHVAKYTERGWTKQPPRQIIRDCITEDNKE